MRYLKTYKIFESTEIDEQVYQDISDICQELEDEGFQCETTKIGDRISVSVRPLLERIEDDDSIIIRPRGFVDFKFDEVEETIKRIYDYMQKNGIISKYPQVNISVQFLNNQYHSAGWDRFFYQKTQYQSEYYERMPIRSVRIEFKVK